MLPKGRRHPICTHCTLALSGVRGHATVQTRGDRKTAKQRRAELQAAAAEPADEKVFRFFDADTEEAESGTDGAGRKGGRRGARRDRRGKAVSAEPGRKPSSAPLPMPAEVAAAAAALKARANGEGSDAEQGRDGRVRRDPGDPTELVTVTGAVARLEELRRQGTPPAGSPVPPVPATATATATADEISTDEGAPEASDPDVGGERPQAEAAAPDTAPARKGGPPPKPRSAAAPTPRPDRRRPEGADREGRPPTAPMVGEVRTIGGRRSSDQAPPPQPARSRAAAAAPTTAEERPTDAAPDDDDELVDVGEALSGVEKFDARHPAAPGDGESDGPRKADTDSRGNWIPPILRGMAPDAR
ncbi:MAG: hypothetical protein R2761_05900, partial [Acidimicrobiales bacterium]